MPAAIDYLSTYLQDHRAGAEMGGALASRLRDENVGTPHEDFLTLLAQQIEEDTVDLDTVMESFGVARSTLKTAGAKLGEKIGRLKPNEQLTGYSPLSRVLEIEGLRAGVQGKLSLWDALHAISGTDERLDAAGLQTLIERAEKQMQGLREYHRMAAREAFAD